MRRALMAVSLLLIALPLLNPNPAPAVAGGEDATRIHLTEKNGYFEVKETLMNLEPGTYVFEVTNEAGKMVGFLVPNSFWGCSPFQCEKTDLIASNSVT